MIFSHSLNRFRHVIIRQDIVNYAIKEIPIGFAVRMAAHDKGCAGIKFFILLLPSGKFGTNDSRPSPSISIQKLIPIFPFILKP